MSAKLIKKIGNDRVLFAIDSASEVSELPRKKVRGQGSLNTVTCGYGSMAMCDDGTVFYLAASDNQWHDSKEMEVEELDSDFSFSAYKMAREKMATSSGSTVDIETVTDAEIETMFNDLKAQYFG